MMWEWFKRQDFWDQLGYIFILITAIYCLYMSFIIPLRYHYATTKQDCGTFMSYYDQLESGKGSVWTNRWLIIQGQTGKQYRFMYHSHYHNEFAFIKTDLKEGQKLCFEYFDPWISHLLGKTFLKSIELQGDK